MKGRVPSALRECQKSVSASCADAIPVAVIDGPCDLSALSAVLAQAPVRLGDGTCSATPDSACGHGTFIVGLLGAREDAWPPGLCPGCKLLHVPLFSDEHEPWASVAGLADALLASVAAGAKLINLSLAIQGDDSKYDLDLAAALDRAEASGAVVLAAAGNQSRLAMGQLLSHSVTIPVVAVDRAGRLLPDCNFGPTIARRGIAAFGHEVPGYAPAGRVVVMSGTSVATAVATGTLARLRSEHPDATGAEVRSAIAGLDCRNGPIPPLLNLHTFRAALNRTVMATVAAAPPAERATTHCARLHGVMTMKHTSELPRSHSRGLGLASVPSQAVTPAQSARGCSCGAPGGACTCADVDSNRFIYVLGTVDIRFPDQSISEELQTVAATLGINQDLERPLREWYGRVLSRSEARYVARQLCWILKVEGQPAYYLVLRDLHDLDDLIKCLTRPEPATPHYHEDLDLLVGSSSLVPVGLCSGIEAPVLAVDQLCSFKSGFQADWFKREPETPAPRPRRGAPAPAEPGPELLNELFKTLVQSADNIGDTDDWRALNYLAARYQPLYEHYVKMISPHDGWILNSVKVMKSRLSRERRILDPVFSFQNLQTGVVKKYFVRVDVTHMFPMIVNHLTEYFDR
jgi:PatG C-terminal/Subtilase family